MTQPSRTRHPLARFLQGIAPLRFLLFVALFAIVLVAHRIAWHEVDWRDGVASAFDVAAVAFLASLAGLVRCADAATMRIHSAENDANRVLVLVLTTLAAFTVLAAIGGELPGAREGEPGAVAKLIGTLLLIWVFANAVYALHYAHAYYLPHRKGAGDAGGLAFPETKTPGYSDFAYFAFTLGMTFQTSDVAITASSVRRIVLLHSFAAFVFNIGVIAFAINVIGGATSTTG